MTDEWTTEDYERLEELDEMDALRFKEELRRRKMKEREDLIIKWREHVGPGWGDLLTRLIDDLFELGWDGQVLQAKEKFGGLRFYVGSGCSRAIYERIHAAENESFETCEQCGAPGELRQGGWLKTLCDEHSKQREEKKK